MRLQVLDRLSLILTLTFHIICHLPFSGATTCYRLDGTPFAKIRPDDGDWVPCDSSSGGISSCCSVKDYCLGNGLCLDAAANNYFSIQGCTDAGWGAPCITSAACENNIQDGYSFIWPCGQVTESTYNYCCGDSPSCCEEKGGLIVIAAVTEIRKPSTTGTETAAATTAATTAVATATVVLADGSSGSNGSILAIGLGAGLGTGFMVLCIVLLCVVYRLRRKDGDARGIRGNGAGLQSGVQYSGGQSYGQSYGVGETDKPMVLDRHLYAAEMGSDPSSQPQELESPPTNHAQWSSQTKDDGHRASPGTDTMAGSAGYGGSSLVSHP